MKTQCPNCNSLYQIDQEIHGQKVECPSCKHEFLATAIQEQIENPQDELNKQLHASSPVNEQFLESAVPPEKLTCEVCGASNFIKQNGVFVCQSCGIQYSLTEIQKILNSKSTQEILEAQCPYCMEYIRNDASKCKHCGTFLASASKRPPRKHIIYLILALFFGTFGIHNFYAGRNIGAFIQIVATLGGILLFLYNPELYKISLFLFVFVALLIFVDISYTYTDEDEVPFS